MFLCLCVEVKAWSLLTYPYSLPRKPCFPDFNLCLYTYKKIEILALMGNRMRVRARARILPPKRLQKIPIDIGHVIQGAFHGKCVNDPFSGFGSHGLS